MKKLILGLTTCGVLSFAAVITQAQVQEHKHEQPEAPAKKDPAAAKTDSAKCCESMEKIGEMKQGAPMKGDMKAKMDSMKAKIGRAHV